MHPKYSYMKVYEYNTVMHKGLLTIRRFLIRRNTHTQKYCISNWFHWQYTLRLDVCKVNSPNYSSLLYYVWVLTPKTMQEIISPTSTHTGRPRWMKPVLTGKQVLSKQYLRKLRNAVLRQRGLLSVPFI